MRQHFGHVNQLSVSIIGVGYHGSHAAAYIRQHKWYQDLPFNYIAVDCKHCSDPASVDETFFIETRTENNKLLFTPAPKKLKTIRDSDCIFVLASLNDFKIAKYMGSICNNPEQLIVYIQLASGADSSADQVIKAESNSAVITTRFQQTSDDATWHRANAYENSSKVIYGIIRPLFHNSIIATEFGELRSFFAGTNFYVAYVLANSENWAVGASSEAIKILQHKGITLADTRVSSVYASIIHKGSLSLDQVDVVTSVLQQELSEKVFLKLAMAVNPEFEPSKTGVFVAVTMK